MGGRVIDCVGRAGDEFAQCNIGYVSKRQQQWGRGEGEQRTQGAAWENEQRENGGGSCGGIKMRGGAGGGGLPGALSPHD